jgi:hypothetical protein
MGFLFVYLFTNPRQKLGDSSPVKQPQRLQNPSQVPGSDFFNGADVSLVPGDEWQRLKSGPLTEQQSIALPVLEGVGQNKGRLIQVFTTGANSDAKTAADILKKEVDANSSTIKGTFKLVNFVSNYRVPVEHVSYDYEVKGAFGSKKLRAHVYLFQNKQHNCIAIHYITFIDKDSARVDQMIRDTLKWN